MRVVKEMRTETAHRLINYPGKCAHLHGHSYRWVVEVDGEPGDDGIVVDFADLKKAMSRVLDPWDHALLLHCDDPLAKSDLTATNGEPGRVFLFPFNPTAEMLARLVMESLKREFNVVRVECWETETCGARACRAC